MTQRQIFSVLITLVLTFALNSPIANAKLIFSTEDPEERSNVFILDVGNDFNQYSIQFGENITAALSFDEISDKFSFNRDVDLGGNEIQDFRLEQLAGAPTCNSASSGRMYFDTTENAVYSCDGTNWKPFKSSVYFGYNVQDWDQTDGSASYIGRTRDSDNKWLITLSVPGGFTYAQIENNGGTTDFTTAWANRLSLNYITSFIP